MRITDRQTDRQRDGQTDYYNSYSFQYAIKVPFLQEVIFRWWQSVWFLFGLPQKNPKNNLHDNFHTSHWLLSLILRQHVSWIQFLLASEQRIHHGEHYLLFTISALPECDTFFLPRQSSPFKAVFVFESQEEHESDSTSRAFPSNLRLACLQPLMCRVVFNIEPYSIFRSRCRFFFRYCKSLHETLPVGCIQSLGSFNLVSCCFCVPG